MGAPLWAVFSCPGSQGTLRGNELLELGTGCWMLLESLGAHWLLGKAECSALIAWDGCFQPVLCSRSGSLSRLML